MDFTFSNQIEMENFCSDSRGEITPLEEAGSLISEEEYNLSKQRFLPVIGHDPLRAKGFSVGKKWVNQLLNLPNCVGLRIFYGVRHVEDYANRELIVAPIDSRGRVIILPTGETLAEQEECYIIGDLRPCPTQCPDGELS
ncbi:MAG: hypothetical protein AAF693_06940 [Bacteroidota bacterium]